MNINPVSSYQHSISKAAHVAANWHGHVITWLAQCEERLERFIPNNTLQRSIENGIDKCIDKIGSYFPDDLKEFNTWLDSNGDGTWYEQISTCLAKMPVRVSRNVLNFLSEFVQILIKWPVYAVLHPLKAPIELAKKFFDLVHALTQPETWSKMGAGLAGSTLGLALAAGGPISLITMAIAGAMVVGGVTFGTLKAALNAHREARLESVGRHLQSEAMQLPEMMLTGLCSGAIMGGVQRLIQSLEPKAVPPSKEAWIRQQVDDYVNRHGLPKDYTVTIARDNRIVIWWNDLYTRIPQKEWVAPPIPLPNPEFWAKSPPTFAAGYTLTKE